MFIESQPINIHDLVIENQPQKDESWFNPLTDLTQEEKLLIWFQGDQIHKRIILQDEGHPRTSIGIEYSKSLTRARESKDIKEITLAVTEMRMLGNTDANLTPDEIQTALQYLPQYSVTVGDANQQHFPANLKLLGIIDTVPKNIYQHMSYVTDSFSSVQMMKNNNYELSILRNLALSGQRDLLPMSFKSSARQYIQEKRERDKEWILFGNNISLMASLALLSANKISLGENGIELTYPTPKINLTPTPPVPIARNF